MNIDRCSVEGCKVVRDDDSKGFCQPTLYAYGRRSKTRLLCEEHLAQLQQVEHDLPLAIQELHALALLYPDFWKVHVGPEDHDLREWVRHAEERVRKLRALETLLKGGE